MTASNVSDACEFVGDGFMEYALDTNNNKAFPDVRDGLKPGARACLWEMYSHGYTHDKPHVKSAKIAGGIIASLWPHGSDAVYETFARMSQDFTENVPEVDFHGANGSMAMGGDDIGASRYTEARMSKMAEDYMLEGVKEDAVDMIPNFLEDSEWPSVMPSVFPRLLVNGYQGIGVSISGYMCGHNLSEVIDLLVKGISGKTVDWGGLMPDFPTGGVLVNPKDIRKINETGRGKVVLEAKYEISGSTITFTEMPYQVYIESVIEEIKKAVEDGDVLGIKPGGVYNASDKDGIRLVIECSRTYDPKEVLSALLSCTSLRQTYNIIQRAIVSKTPELLTTEQVAKEYIAHNKECIRRVCQHRIADADEKIELIDAILAVLNDTGGVMSGIMSSDDPEEFLKNSLGINQRQARYILSSNLSRFTKASKEKLESDRAWIVASRAQQSKIVSSDAELGKELVRRLKKLDKEYGTFRKTMIGEPSASFSTSFNKYIVKLDGDVMRKEKSTDGLQDTDFILLASDDGKAFRVKVSDVTDGCNASMLVGGKRRVVAMNSDDLVIVTQDGKVKSVDMTTEAAGNVRNTVGIPMCKKPALYCGLAESGLSVEFESGKIVRLDRAAMQKASFSHGGFKIPRCPVGQKIVSVKELSKK